MRKSNDGKTLILLETEAQVRDCLSWIGDLEGDILLIALSPFARFELDKKRIHYRIIEEYYSAEELYKLGIDNFIKVEELCQIIDSYILRYNKKLKEYRITPAFFNLYYLKIIYDSVTIRLFKLNKLIKSENPDTIIVYETEKGFFGAVEEAPNILFNNSESIYSQLLSLSGWEPKIINKRSLKETLDRCYKKDIKYFTNLMIIKNLIGRNPLLSELGAVFTKKGVSGMLNYLKNILVTNNKTPIIILGPGYNWDDCLENLDKAGITPRYRLSQDFGWLKKSLISDPSPSKMVWESLMNNEKFNNFFNDSNIIFLPILETRISFLIERITLACIYAYEDCTRLITGKRIKAVISSVIFTPEGHTIAQAAHNAGIPVITWQHGGYGEADLPILKYTGLINSDIYFVFGDGVHKYMERSAKASGTKLVTVGSSSLEKIRYNKIEPKKSTKKVILYITSALVQNCSHISAFPPFEDNYFWETQKTIIDTLGKYKDFNIIVKLHPTEINDPLVCSYVKEKGFSNFEFIKNERSVVELVSVADAIVIDYPFTTLLQSLIASKPLFVYLGHINYDDEACYLLEKRAVCSKEIKSFNEKLNKYMSSSIYEADMNNKELLNHYGTTSSGGSSCMRATLTLKKIIKEFKSRNTHHEGIR